jgi:hypothetical protein
MKMVLVQKIQVAVYLVKKAMSINKMKLFFIAGLLYLTGVAVVLYLRPQLMFTKDGVWKEFGIGKNSETHTWFPFWLFCIVWAFLSYFIVVLLSPSELWTNSIEVSSPAASAKKASPHRRVRYAEKAKPGYYVLNTEGSGVEGVPKYVYLGPTLPEEGQA